VFKSLLKHAFSKRGEPGPHTPIVALGLTVALTVISIWDNGKREIAIPRVIKTGRKNFRRQAALFFKGKGFTPGMNKKTK